MRTQQNALLKIENLQVHLSGREILKQVNLTVWNGQILGLLGPNGAGKTTLLRAILGLIDHSSGSITINGKETSKHADEIQKIIGYVPQRSGTNWDFPISVIEFVTTGLTRQIGWGKSARTQHWEAAFDALERVEMTSFSTRPIAQLSGGQRQRLVIARALVTKPQLLILDEPFTGLDMPTQELLTDLYKKLSQSGTSLLLTTHDLAHAILTCDQLALLRGRIIAQGAPRQLDHPSLWQETFEVGPENPIIKQLRLITC